MLPSARRALGAVKSALISPRRAPRSCAMATSRPSPRLACTRASLRPSARSPNTRSPLSRQTPMRPTGSAAGLPSSTSVQSPASTKGCGFAALSAVSLACSDGNSARSVCGRICCQRPALCQRPLSSASCSRRRSPTSPSKAAGPKATADPAMLSAAGLTRCSKGALLAVCRLPRFSSLSTPRQASDEAAPDRRFACAARPPSSTKRSSRRRSFSSLSPSCPVKRCWLRMPSTSSSTVSAGIPCAGIAHAVQRSRPRK